MVPALFLGTYVPCVLSQQCTDMTRMLDLNYASSFIRSNIGGSNLKITQSKLIHNWTGGGDQSEIYRWSGCSCIGNNPPPLGGTVTTPYSNVGSWTIIRDDNPQILSAGDPGGMLLYSTDIPAVSGVEVLAHLTNSGGYIEYFSTIYNRASSWTYYDCVVDPATADWHGGRGVACQRSHDTVELNVTRQYAGAFSVAVDWKFTNGVYSEYHDHPKAAQQGCPTISWVGTPGLVPQNHFVRIKVRALSSTGAVLATFGPVSARASGNQGSLTRSGFYADQYALWNAPQTVGESCNGNYTTDSSLAVPPYPDDCDNNHPWCRAFTISSTTYPTLAKIQIIREFDAICFTSDVTSDGVVDLLDRSTTVGLIGTSIGPDGSGNFDPDYNPYADADGDGDIDQTDLDLFDDSNCTADTDASGSLDTFDYLLFNNWFNANDPRADMDADGSFTLFDSQAYNNLFNAGCP